MSRIFVVSYDLRQPGRNYEALYQGLKSYPNWARPLESFWIVVTPAGSEQIRNHLMQYMDSNDRLIVAQLTGDAAWNNIAPDASAWMKAELTRHWAAR